MNNLKYTSFKKRFISNNFHALTHKDFRYFWLGQCVSLIGTWAQSIGQSWLVLTLTNSPFKLGVVGTVQFIPITILSLFAGVIVDRFSKKKILLITQSVSMMLAFILSALVFTNKVQYEYILILAFILGCCNAVDMPTRQSFTVEIAGREDLMNAIALNSIIFNLGRIVGPAIGALMMAYMGAQWCFLINGLSFVAVIYGLYHIESKVYVRKKNPDKNIFEEINDGIKYIVKNPKLMETLFMVTVVGIFVFNFSVLVPVFTRDVLHMQEKTYGALIASLGVGSLIGALTASVRSKKGPRKFVMVSSTLTIAIMLIITGMTTSYYQTAICLAITGIFNIFFSTTANSTLQINAEDEYRGRVMSVYSLLFAGSTPIGNLFSGTVANKLGASMGFMICGILTLSFISIIYVVFRHIEKSNKSLC